MNSDDVALGEIAIELARARRLHTGRFASAHEGLSVIEEEYIELRLEVYKKQRSRDVEKMRAEAIQIAAMAARFASDLT